jgi:hypothetical protein
MFKIIHFFGVTGGEKQIFWQPSGQSFYFNANDDNANFNERINPANANDDYSGGLLFR